MDKRLGGAQRLDLYVRALTQMSENPHLPQLFRTIFKGTFLPYRDFETLNLFLKEINGFVYDHSERLGDAFEYLLSVLGSQGKVGQFRTPRHIIDFIVEIVAPTKRETVLDPACGTAGFLISAYKHILNKNADTPLTPAERERLTSNFVGYDISPDMVRLSLVNMYLHQFPNPTIVEYDTLTSDARWDDGFGTGAQRRPTEQNDLPAALRLIQQFQADPRAALAHVVAKSDIAADGDYNLSGGRYREAVDYSNVEWPLVKLGDVFTKITDSIDPKQHTGNITYIGLENIESHTGSIVGEYTAEISTIKSNKSRFKQGDILYGKLRPNLNKVCLATNSGICSTDIFVLCGDENAVIPNFYAPFFRSEQFNTEVLKGLSGAQLPRVGWKYFASIKIPLPPLAVQEAIVAEIEGYQQEIEDARQSITLSEEKIAAAIARVWGA